MGWLAGCDTSVRATDTNSKTPLAAFEGVVVHTIGGGDGAAAAATWSVRRDGHIWQSRDDNNRTSANADGNPYLLAIETGDRGPGWPAWDVRNPPRDFPPWTPEQCTSIAIIFVHLHRTKGMPLDLMPDSKPGRKGIGYHRQGIDGNFGTYAYPGRVVGGRRWSTVFGKVCPTDVRIKQLIEIVIPMARQLAGLEGGTVTSPAAVWSEPLQGSTLATPPATVTFTARQWLTYANIYAGEIYNRVTQSIQPTLAAHGTAIAQTRTMVEQIRDAVVGSGATDETKWDDVVEAAAAAAREGGQSGARLAVEQAVVPALRPMLLELLGEDNEAQADEVLHRLGEKLVERATDTAA